MEITFLLLRFYVKSIKEIHIKSEDQNISFLFFSCLHCSKGITKPVDLSSNHMSATFYAWFIVDMGLFWFGVILT